MKKSLFLVPVLITLFFAAKCAPPRVDGIAFYDKTWQEVLIKAKKEHKPIFLDIYATWCGPCKKLRRETFPDESAATYFNAHFVSTSFDGEQGDGVMLSRKFNIQGYPALFILDENGNIIKTSLGFLSPEELIQFGRHALNNK